MTLKQIVTIFEEHFTEKRIRQKERCKANVQLVAAENKMLAEQGAGGCGLQMRSKARQTLTHSAEWQHIDAQIKQNWTDYFEQKEILLEKTNTKLLAATNGSEMGEFLMEGLMLYEGVLTASTRIFDDNQRINVALKTRMAMTENRF